MSWFRCRVSADRRASADRGMFTGRRPSADRGAFAIRRAFAIVFTCVAAVGASVLISACGRGGSSSPESKGGLPKAAQADAVKFAKCMREHGIKVETSASGGGIQTKIGGGPSEVNKTALKTASEACRRYMPNEGKAVKLSPAEEAKQREAALKFARCMRSHGVDVTDSASGTVELPSGVNPQSATFEDAQKDCQGDMGNLPLRIHSSGPGGESSSESARVGG